MIKVVKVVRIAMIKQYRIFKCYQIIGEYQICFSFCMSILSLKTTKNGPVHGDGSWFIVPLVL